MIVQNYKMPNTFIAVLYMSFISIIFISAIFLTGCSADGEKLVALQSDEEYTNIDYEIIDKDTIINSQILDWIDENYQIQGIYSKDFIRNSSNDTYILISEGEKSTGGFSIIIDGISGNSDEIRVKTTLLEPSKRELVCQGFAYPHILLKIKQDKRKIILDKQ